MQNSALFIAWSTKLNIRICGKHFFPCLMRWLLSEHGWNLKSTDVYSCNGYGMEMNSSGSSKDRCLHLGFDILLALASIQFLCIVQRALGTDGCNVTRVTAVTHGTNSDSWISTFMRQCISTERCLLASKELSWSILLPQSRSKPHQDEASWCQHTALAEISKSKVLHFATTLSQNMPFFVNTAISNMLP